MLRVTPFPLPLSPVLSCLNPQSLPLSPRLPHSWPQSPPPPPPCTCCCSCYRGLTRPCCSHISSARDYVSRLEVLFRPRDSPPSVHTDLGPALTWRGSADLQGVYEAAFLVHGKKGGDKGRKGRWLGRRKEGKGSRESKPGIRKDIRENVGEETYVV